MALPCTFQGAYTSQAEWSRMEVKVIKIPDMLTDRVTIECREVTEQIDSIVRFVKLLSGTISGQQEQRVFEIAIDDIYYIESVDNRTFLYTEREVYQTDKKLYELESILKDASFIRISKAVIVNLMKINGISSALNGRFSATLTNGEDVIITRKYVPEFKEKISGGKRA